MGSRVAQGPAYPAAPRIRRITAGVIDLAFGGIFLLPMVALPAWLEPFAKSNLLIQLVPFVPGFYLLLRDSVGGRSIGKLVVGLVAWDHNLGHPATPIDSLVRNWPFAIVLVPWIGVPTAGAVVLVMGLQVLIGRSQRFGDGFATTQVIDARWLEPR